MIEDAEAVRKVCDGDVDSFEILVERYKKLVFTVVGRRVPDADVPDVAHEVFLRAYRALFSLADPSLFRNWLMTLAVRACCDYWRKNQNRIHVPIEEMKYEEQEEKTTNKDGCRELLNYVMNKLAPDEKSLIEIVYFEEKGIREAAEAFGWGLAKTKVKAMRARHKMRKIIQDMDI